MNKDLTTGKVFNNIIKLAIPIIGTSFMQLAYSLTDMLWVGRLGSNAVAAIGTAGFFLHLGWAIVSIILVGAGISVSQAVGRKDETEAKFLSINALFGMVFLTGLYIILVHWGSNYFIGFFDLNDLPTENMAERYLRWSSIGLFFLFFSRLFSGISNSRGDSKLPFKIASVGIVINIILDPILIFVFDFGVVGAAWATITAQVFVAFLYLNKRGLFFFGHHSTWKFDIKSIKNMMKLGFPPSTQYIVFSLVAIVMGKIVSEFGSNAIAAQKIGLQVEAISFMTIAGFYGAITAFTGQNFGAKLYNRVREGWKAGIKLALSVGVIMTIVFFIFAEDMVRCFVSDIETIKIGASYIMIVGLSQIFVSIDHISTGVLNGIGKTKYPASSNIIMILLRIPLALFLSQESMFGLNGVWMAILFSTMLRGTANVSMYFYFRDRFLPKTKGQKEDSQLNNTLEF